MDGPASISWVKVTNVVDSGFGDIVEEDFHQVAVGVDDGHTFTIFHVIDGHIGDEGGFAGTGFTNDVNVFAPVLALDAKDGGVVFELGAGEEVDFFFFFYG